jgi:hypothetical protein
MNLMPPMHGDGAFDDVHAYYSDGGIPTQPGEKYLAGDEPAAAWRCAN